jgi:hypothetical protein
MREAHRHVVFGTLVVEHRLQPRLGRIERHAIPSPLNSIEDILYEVAADVEPLAHCVGTEYAALPELAGE